MDIEFDRGYVICPRSIDKLPIELCILYKYLLSKATYKPRNNLETGQVKTTISDLVHVFRSMNISERLMRIRLQKLIDEDLLTYERGFKGHPSIITICHYKDIQNPSNYGKLSVSNTEVNGELSGTNISNNGNGLPESEKVNGKLSVGNREDKRQPLKEISNNKESNNINTLSQIKEIWNSRVKGTNLVTVKSLKAIEAKMKARLKEEPDLEIWKGAIDVILTNRHWHGENDRGWRGNLGTFLQPEKFELYCAMHINGQTFDKASKSTARKDNYSPEEMREILKRKSFKHDRSFDDEKL